MEQKTLFRWSAGEPVKKMQLSATAEPEAPRRDLYVAPVAR